MDFNTIEKVNTYNRKEGHRTLSAGLTTLVKLGLAHDMMLDEQDKYQRTLTGDKAHGTAH